MTMSQSSVGTGFSRDLWYMMYSRAWESRLPNHLSWTGRQKREIHVSAGQHYMRFIMSIPWFKCQLQHISPELQEWDLFVNVITVPQPDYFHHATHFLISPFLLLIKSVKRAFLFINIHSHTGNIAMENPGRKSWPSAHNYFHHWNLCM